MKNKKLLATLASTAGLAAAIAPAVCLTSCGHKSHFSNVSVEFIEGQEQSDYIVWEGTYVKEENHDLTFIGSWWTINDEMMDEPPEVPISIAGGNLWRLDQPIKIRTAADQMAKIAFEAYCTDKITKKVLWTEHIEFAHVIPRSGG